jgi:N-methylhydantoinase A
MDQYAMHLSMVDVQSIGAGGGSIAWVDERSGSIKVGPRSAAADPGPVCYGRGGTEPTVTDADLVLGFIGTDSFLGGRQHLDADAARSAVSSLAERVGLSVEEAAAGIVDIVDTIMSEKIRRMTVDRGHDPRSFVIYAFGGAGPMHAVGFSRHLGVRTVVVPVGNIASVLSALGTVSGDIVTAIDRSVRLIAPLDGAEIEHTFAELEAEARARLVADGFGEARLRSERTVSMKYAAQAFDVELPADDLADGDAYVDRFVAAYAARYGPSAGYAPAGIALTSMRVKMSALLDKPVLAESAAARLTEQRGTRKVWWPEHREFVDTPILSRVGTGASVTGPAIVELADTTVPIRPGTSVRADAFGNLVINLEEGT